MTFKIGDRVILQNTSHTHLDGIEGVITKNDGAVYLIKIPFHDVVIAESQMRHAPAAPAPDLAQWGMRDWFAGLAMRGMAPVSFYEDSDRSELARRAYGIADAMLAAREVKS